ncbi:MAG TPA: BrnT family toxin [Gemmataceae bacterium]|nr:BrnT family toxin [Gemmataceae bacterium]
MSLEFEWDEDKAASNQKKHRVSFEEAAAVFADPLAVVFDDEAHAEEEQREIIIGHSAKDQLLLVCFTERAGAIRIISARRATKRERRDYEENTNR